MMELLYNWGPTLLVLFAFVIGMVSMQSRAKRVSERQLELNAAQVAESQKLNQTLERIAAALEKGRS
jgi:hypothetical protein